MDFNEIITFEGGLNTDDTPQGMPKGDYRDFSYCRLGYNSGNAFAVETSDGTIEITNSTITVDDKVLGATQWLKENAIVYFLYKDTGIHEILVYYIATQTHRVVVQDAVLNFSPDWPVFHANVIDDILKWTDGRWDPVMYEADGTRLFNPPYQINIRKALDNFYNSIDIQDIDAVKWPLPPPRVSYFTDINRNDNKLRGKLFKFIIQPIYENGEIGVWSMYSNLNLPERSELVSGTNWVFLNNSNGINIEFYTGPRVIRKFNIAVQQFDQESLGSEPPFAVFIQLDKGQDNIPDESYHVISFYGGVSTAPAIDVFKNYDRLPVIADCQEYLPTNQLVYSNFKEGYDKPNQPYEELNVTVGYDVNEIKYFGFRNFNLALKKTTISGQAGSSSSQWTVTVDYSIFQWNVGDVVSLTLRFVSNTPSLITVSYTVSEDDIEYVLTNVGSFGNANISMLSRRVLPGLVAAANAIDPGILSAGAIIPGMTQATLTFNSLVAEMWVNGETIPTNPLDVNRRQVPVVRSTNCLPSLKVGATHEFGIVYGDRAYRDGTVYTVNSMNLFVPWFYNIDKSSFQDVKNPFTISPNITIDHIPPVWADRYWIVSKPATEILSFGQYVINKSDTGGFQAAITYDAEYDRYKIEIDNYYEKNNRGATIKHEIKKGDKMRFIRSNGIANEYLPYLEVDILEVSNTGNNGRKVVYTNLFDTGLIEPYLAISNNNLFGQQIEIYTPRPSIDDTGDVFVSAWKDISESIEIRDAHTENRSHGAPAKYYLNVGIPQGFLTEEIFINGDYTFLNGTNQNITIYYDNNTTAVFTDIYISSVTYYSNENISIFNFGSPIYSTVLQPDGKIVIAGDFTSYNGTDQNYIARLNSDGSLDTTFNTGTGTDGVVYSASLQSDGKIIIAGNFITYNGTSRNRIARLNTDGTLDTTFNPNLGANNNIKTTSLQSDGKIIIGGDFTIYDGTSRNRIARLNTDGTLDTTFNPGAGANNIIQTIALQTDGKIVVGGDFTTYDGTSRNRIARLNSDGSLDTTFNPGTGADATIHAIAIQSDGKIIIGGSFLNYSIYAIYRIARLNPDGTVDVSFSPILGPNGDVYSINIQSDGKIIIGGNFTIYQTTTQNRISRLNSNGSLDISFTSGAGANSFVYSTSIQPDGKIIIGGQFTNYDGTDRNSIGRLNSNGTLDTSFNPGSGASGITANLFMLYISLDNSYQVVDALSSFSPAQFSLSYGDVYLRQRNCLTGLDGGQKIYYYYFEDPHYSDYWNSNIHNTGRIRIEDQNAKMVHRNASSIHSEAFIVGTQINGLSSFALDNQNIEDMNPLYGEIVRTHMSGREGKTLKCLQPKRENSIYIQFYPNEVGSDSTVRVSNKTFASWFDYKSLYGCTDAGATALLPNGSVMYFDNNSGVFIYSGGNGQIVVSEIDPDSGKDYKFRTKTKELAKAYNDNPNPVVRTYVNETVGEVGFAFKLQKIDLIGTEINPNQITYDDEEFVSNDSSQYQVGDLIEIVDIELGTILYTGNVVSVVGDTVNVGPDPILNTIFADTAVIKRSRYVYYNDHVVFDYVNMRWRSTYDYNFAQFCNLGQTLVGWGENNQLYLHNQPGEWTFHGDPFIQKVKFVSNENPLLLKRYQDITLISDDKFSIEASSEPNRSYPLGMKTMMTENLLGMYEGYGKTNYRKNLYDPKFWVPGNISTTNSNTWTLNGNQTSLNGEMITIVQNDKNVYTGIIDNPVYTPGPNTTEIELVNLEPNTYGVEGKWYLSERVLLNGEDVRANALTHTLSYDPAGPGALGEGSVLFSVGIKGVLS